MQKTCYQELVERVVNEGNKLLFCTMINELFPMFAKRGYSLEEFCDWYKIVFETYKLIMENGDLSLNAVKEIARKQFDMPIPSYRLTEDEIRTIYESEEFGAGTSGVLYEYSDSRGLKDVRLYPAMKIPCCEGGRQDVLVVFSGHPESATIAAQAFYKYVRRHRQLPYGIMFLGLEDNQNMTEFNPKFKLRKNSEYRMYMRQMLALGISKDLCGKLLMTPNDTSTAGNIELIADTLRKYDLHDVNLICVTYPLYQLRVASELPFGLRKLGITDAWVRIAEVPIKPTKPTRKITDATQVFAMREFSYDQAEFQLADLSLANGVAHLFREHGKNRFAIPGLVEGKYPRQFKSLAPLFLAYSYPNVMKELIGTDEMVSSVLKIIRTLMLDAHDTGVSGEAQDVQQVMNTIHTAEVMVLEGLVSEEIIRKGAMMNSGDFLQALCKFYDSIE